MNEKACILVVDDEESQRKSLSLILKKKGYPVESAGNGAEALEKAAGRTISVALLDIKLPDTDGVDLIAPLKLLNPDMGIIMFTGFASVENTVRSMNAGASGYLVKPVNFEELLIKVQDLIERQDMIREKRQAEETIRRALAEKEVLLQEIHHRVKNNLASIIALIGLQAATIKDPAMLSMLRDLETRIQSMALVHESLCRTKDLARITIAGYTEDLTRHLFQVYGKGGSIRCTIQMGDITIPIDTAIPCGLVMNEILTNSLKHAFPDTFSCKVQRGGPCTIALSMQHEGSDYLLNIADNGIGIPERNVGINSHEFGLFLIRLIVERQLHGSLEITTSGGTAYSIRFPEPVARVWTTDEPVT